MGGEAALRITWVTVIERLSHLFLRTLRDDPADAEVPSHKLLIRAGYIRRAAPGIYTWLPLGLKVLARVEAVVREEMEAIGAQELSFPALLPREPYEATNRWDEYGPNLFRLQDRKTRPTRFDGVISRMAEALRPSEGCQHPPIAAAAGEAPN